MQIVAHRGYWFERTEQNSISALRRARSMGFGVETDVRDCNGSLVIAHDPPGVAKCALDFASYLESEDLPGVLAINIKSDGLHQLVYEATKKLSKDKYFVFDMSIPDTLNYLRIGVPAYIRHSEYEVPTCALLERAAGVWVDCFSSIWFDETLVAEYLKRGLYVALVSPELHGRNRNELWVNLRDWEFSKNPRVIICTDHPVEAERFFHG